MSELSVESAFLQVADVLNQCSGACRAGTNVVECMPGPQVPQERTVCVRVSAC